MAGYDFVPTIHHDTYPLIDPAKADLSGKAVLITGASKGVGRSTAIAFATAGCRRIALLARSPLADVEAAVQAAAAQAGRSTPVDVLALSGVDVTSEEAVRRAAEEVGARFGSLDVVIANAGFLETWKPLAETDPKSWWHSWEVNLHGTYLTTRYFMPLLLPEAETATATATASKTLVLLSSIGAHFTFPGASAYQTAKFALCRLAEFANVEYGSRGLVTVAVHPGGVLTELAQNMPADRHKLLIDTPELPADTLVWLTREPRPWLSGRYLSCCWDVEELEGKKDEIVEKDLLKFRMAF